MEVTTVFSSITQETSNETLTGKYDHCAVFGGDQRKCDAVLGVKRATSIVSLLGSLFIIAVIVLFKKWIVFPQKLVLYLSIANLLASIMYILAGVHQEGVWCKCRAGIAQFADWAVLLWVCIITFNLYMNAVRMTLTEKYEWAYHGVCWGVALVMSLIPAIADKYGPAGVWCWIVDEWEWRFGVRYIPVFVILVMLFITYTYITIRVTRMAKTWAGTYDPDTQRKKEQMREHVKYLRWYPFVFLLVSIFPIIHRIHDAISHHSTFVLVFLHAMSSTFLGAANAFVFVLDKETRSKLNCVDIKIQCRHRLQEDQKPIRPYPPSNPDLVMDALPSSTHV